MPYGLQMNFAIGFFHFLRDLLRSRRLIWDLAKRDFRAKYLSSYLGVLWAFVQPVVSVLILWFVFEMGFKAGSAGDFPFVLWLLAGIFPWFFLSESVSQATQAILENSHLVKKMVFRVSVLPIIKILSALIVHVFFLFLLMIIFLLYGYRPDIHVVQVAYYLLASFVLLLGISWITSSLVVFVRDIGQVVTMLMQLLFWLTPIFWSPRIMPEAIRPFIRLNPFYYICEGYRQSLLYRTWFWEDLSLTLYFWAFTGVVFVFGGVLFNRLRPHFADVI